MQPEIIVEILFDDSLMLLEKIENNIIDGDKIKEVKCSTSR